MPRTSRSISPALDAQDFKGRYCTRTQLFALKNGNRICSICTIRYGEPSPDEEGRPETPIQINFGNCHHVFGHRCFRKLIDCGQPWSNKCPLCRAHWFRTFRDIEAEELAEILFELQNAEELGGPGSNSAMPSGGNHDRGSTIQQPNRTHSVQESADPLPYPERRSEPLSPGEEERRIPEYQSPPSRGRRFWLRFRDYVAILRIIRLFRRDERAAMELIEEGLPSQRHGVATRTIGIRDREARVVTRSDRRRTNLFQSRDRRTRVPAPVGAHYYGPRNNQVSDDPVYSDNAIYQRLRGLTESIYGPRNNQIYNDPIYSDNANYHRLVDLRESVFGPDRRGSPEFEAAIDRLDRLFVNEYYSHWGL